MSVVSWLAPSIALTAAFPLWRAWRANRGTTLRHALAWGAGAWGAWVLTFVAVAAGRDNLAQHGRYAGLCLTGCAGIAVLGARRPGVGAWNFVVLGLLVTLLLPMARGLGEVRLDTAFLVFLGATLGVGLANFFPTRAGVPALLIAAGGAVEFVVLVDADLRAESGYWLSLVSAFCLAAGPWLALVLLMGGRGQTEIASLWFAFRDRFGVVWGQRLREQFNRAAENAGWPVTLTWFGPIIRTDSAHTDMTPALTGLRALMKRFVTDLD